jgi:AbrB family looped-hinge helix DNA binding protein
MSVTQKGQLVIPKELRDKHGIAPNSQVIVTEIGDHIAILPAADPIRQGRGMLRFDRPVAELLKEGRRDEFRRDARLTPKKRKHASKDR